MKVQFKAFGHPNITATHRTTFEFTEEKDLSKEGTCIVGVSSKIPSVKRFLSKDKIIITISTGKFYEIIHAEPNPNFVRGKEFVVRKSDYLSSRTFAIRADKAAAEFDRKMIALLESPQQEIIIEVSDSP